MATLYAYFFFFFTLIVITMYYYWTTHRRKPTTVPTDWPLLGMLPGLLRNCHRVHDYATGVLMESGGAFWWKGPWFCNMDFFLTSDPATIHHIFSKNFSNYPKGPEYNRIFEILGDGIFNADFALWELHRRTTMAFMTHPDFQALLETAVWEKIHAGLLPVLDHFCAAGVDADLQDIFQRLTFDTTCKLILDHDPRSLCPEMPYIRCEKAFNDAVEALLHRHVLPEWVWKLQKWLQVGKEKKLKRAWEAFDEFIYGCLDRTEAEKMAAAAEGEREREREGRPQLSLLASFKKAYEDQTTTAASPAASRKFLKDTALNLMIAGRDTTSTCLTWLFWLIAQNPAAEAKIREEMEAQLNLKEWRPFTVNESKKLTYLHGALCESLRLYPPVALEHKAPIRPDNLPCGGFIEENTRVIVSFYSVGRMEAVWGKDCLQFKPERWMTARGGTKHEPSYKFVAFNAGPRTCLGKEMAFIHMKMTAATIIYHYNIQVVEGQTVAPRDSIILQTRHGLKVRLSRRMDRS